MELATATATLFLRSETCDITFRGLSAMCNTDTVDLVNRANRWGRAVILEVAILDVKQGQERAFETAFMLAQEIVASMPGYVSHELQACIENSSRYLLLVNWKTLEDHTIGFRESPEYQEWRALLHHFYDPFPQVEHYRSVI